MNRDRAYSLPVFSQSGKGLSFSGSGDFLPLAEGIFCLIVGDFLQGNGKPQERRISLMRVVFTLLGCQPCAKVRRRKNRGR